jgi:hypothetical protein
MYKLHTFPISHIIQAIPTGVQLQPKHLCSDGSWGGRSVGVDIGAEQSLTQDWDQAALGLLALLSAGGDESGVVDWDCCG